MDELGVVLHGIGPLDLEYPKLAVRMAAVVEPRDRLLARVAPLGERDRPFLEPCLGGEDAVVELVAGDGRPGADAEAFELVVGDRIGVPDVGVDHLAGRDPVVVVRDRAVEDGADDERRAVLFGLDRALRREAAAREIAANPLAEVGLGEEQEVVVSAAQHGQRRDDARLRGEEQGQAGLAHREGRRRRSTPCG